MEKYKGYLIKEYKGKSKNIKFYAPGNINLYGSTINEIKSKIDKEEKNNINYLFFD